MRDRFRQIEESAANRKRAKQKPISAYAAILLTKGEAAIERRKLAKEPPRIQNEIPRFFPRVAYEK